MRRQSVMKARPGEHRSARALPRQRPKARSQPRRITYEVVMSDTKSSAMPASVQQRRLSRLAPPARPPGKNGSPLGFSSAHQRSCPASGPDAGRLRPARAERRCEAKGSGRRSETDGARTPIRHAARTDPAQFRRARPRRSWSAETRRSPPSRSAARGHCAYTRRTGS